MSARRFSPVAPVFGALVAIAIAACGSTQASGPSTTTNEDAGSQTPPSTDGGGPVSTRTLVTVPFLDGMPSDNRVGDPSLEMDTASWFFEDRINYQTPTHVKKAAFAIGPQTQNALFFPAANDADGVTMGVRFKIPTTAYDATLWLATPAGANAAGVQVGVITFDVGGLGQPRYIEMSADATSAKDIAGTHWIAYRGTVTPDVVSGWGYLYAQTDGASDYWVASPLITASGAGPHPRPVATSRPADDRMKTWLAHARAARPEPRAQRVGYGEHVRAAR